MEGNKRLLPCCEMGRPSLEVHTKFIGCILDIPVHETSTLLPSYTCVTPDIVMENSNIVKTKEQIYGK